MVLIRGPARQFQISNLHTSNCRHPDRILKFTIEWASGISELPFQRSLPSFWSGWQVFSGGFWRSPTRLFKRHKAASFAYSAIIAGTVRYASHSFGSGVSFSNNGAGDARSWPVMRPPPPPDHGIRRQCRAARLRMAAFAADG
eukprot:767500-Hanusia_phi.AAC.3